MQRRRRSTGRQRNRDYCSKQSGPLTSFERLSLFLPVRREEGAVSRVLPTLKPISVITCSVSINQPTQHTHTNKELTHIAD